MDGSRGALCLMGTSLARAFAAAKQREVQSPQEALAIYLDLYRQAPLYPNLNFRMGLLYYREQQWQAAAEAFSHELQVHPEFVGSWYHLGVSFGKLGRWADACEALQKSLALCVLPEEKVPIALALAEFQLKQTHTQAALGTLSQLKHPRRDWLLAQAYRQSGHIEQALFFFEKALDKGAFPWQAYLEVALFFSEYRRHAQAERYLQAVINAPDASVESKAQAYLHQAHGLADRGEATEALWALRQAVSLCPGVGYELAEATLIPAVYRSEDELIQWRQRVENTLQHGLEMPLQSEVNPLIHLGAMPFYLAYQGFNEVSLLHKWSQVLRRLLPSLSDSDFKKRTGPLRVGFVSRFFYEHSIMHTFLRTIAACAQHFEVHLLSPGRFIEDHLTGELKSMGTWHVLEGELISQAEAIQSLNLDTLIYVELGIDLNSYALAHYRLAPLQYVLPAHPITSGIKDTLDGYLSTEVYEQSNAQEQYTEPLVLLKHSFSSYAPPAVPRYIKTRAQLNLPQGQHLYFCPMNLYKIHPHFDPVLKGILDRDPRGVVLCLQRGHNDGANILKARFQETLGAVANRVLFYPWYSPEDFIQVLCQVDVLLETFPFGSYNTLFQAFAVGTPVVIKETPYLRGRFGVGMYQKMGLKDWVAQSNEAYIDQAVTWGTDVNAREQARKTLLNKKACLFNDETGLHELVHFLRAQMQNRRAT